jgi:hypothetical protein
MAGLKHSTLSVGEPPIIETVENAASPACTAAACIFDGLEEQQRIGGVIYFLDHFEFQLAHIQAAIDFEEL